MTLKEISNSYHVSMTVTIQHDHASISYSKLFIDGKWENGWNGGNISSYGGEIAEKLFSKYENEIIAKAKQFDLDELTERAEGYKTILDETEDGLNIFATLDWECKF